MAYKNPLEQAQALIPNEQRSLDFNDLSQFIKDALKLPQEERYKYNKSIFGRDNFDELETIVPDLDGVSYNEAIQKLEDAVYNLKPGETIDVGNGDSFDIWNGADIISQVNLLNGYENGLQSNSLKNFYNSRKYDIDTRHENSARFGRNYKPARYIKKLKLRTIPKYGGQ